MVIHSDLRFTPGLLVFGLVVWMASCGEPPSDMPSQRAEVDTTDSAAGPAEAADVLGHYYDAINARDFRRAYELWGDRGAASGQSFEEFAAGFSETERVELEMGRPGRVKAASGSRYVAIPAILQAVTRDGEEQRFEGTYTLRRAMVEGATVDQRRWHIYNASLSRIR